MCNSTYGMRLCHAMSPHTDSLFCRPSVVRLGEVDFNRADEGLAFDYDVGGVQVHEGYALPAKYNDIAIITLKHPVRNLFSWYTRVTKTRAASTVNTFFFVKTFYSSYLCAIFCIHRLCNSKFSGHEFWGGRRGTAFWIICYLRWYDKYDNKWSICTLNKIQLVTFSPRWNYRKHCSHTVYDGEVLIWLAST